MLKQREFWMIMAASLSLGLLGVLLTVWGNPENSGICVSCFLENSAGALGLHANERMQYLRPELIGFVLGAMGSALLFREFRSRGGNAPLGRFTAGFFLIVGCAIFIGCPIKLFLRLTAGDLTALAALGGLVAGVWLGLRSLAAGVHFGMSTPQRGGTGFVVPALFALLLVFALVQPSFILTSSRGSAAQHAPLLLSLGAGVLLGFLAQRSRFCITGGVRDALVLGRRAPLLWGLIAFTGAAVLANLLIGRFEPGFYGQPGAHLEHAWSFLGMGLVGWISVLVGGCPFRQLIKAGEGDTDAGMVVLGMLIGAAVVQGWGLAATAAGVPVYGKVAVLVGLALVLLTGLLMRERSA
ncbi:YedE family putative selenium transporter [Geoalkalibacter sp.]|uniref:YedE family putative selenium transporter n=1 Tax=Geoalkalibacter sp. TaxID=3041440 RepID=UPI00272E6EDF|nr:YedE family putative selenium transporter [Geoalkalibacter sp.]